MQGREMLETDVPPDRPGDILVSDPWAVGGQMLMEIRAGARGSG